jgi:hypothetical protein
LNTAEPASRFATLAARARVHLAVLAGYLCIAVAFAWPLPLHLATALPGPFVTDTGVYVWNLWVFRHEIVAHHQLPFVTLEILSLSPPVPLALHNYTTIANIVAFPFLPLLGTVATYNFLLIGSGVLSAYAMFLFARRTVADNGAAWLAGLLFGFSPFMSARTMEHFSLVQTAPLVLFALLFDRLRSAQTVGVAAAMGAAVAMAFLCDPYYAVYCVLMGAFAIAYSAVAIHDSTGPASPRMRTILNVGIICLGGLIVGIVARGGGRFELLGVRVSMTQLYTPVLLFTLVIAVRVWISLRSRVAWLVPSALPPVRVVVVGAIVCLAVLSPVLWAVGAHVSERHWISPRILWRSSAAGLDLFALLVPNPLHPWFGHFFQGWLSRLPHTFIENVASIPWTVIGILAGAIITARASIPRYWIAFTAFFGWLALGPFVHIAGQNIYVPTPWTLLRYLPVVGAARMPTRLIAVVMFGVAVLLAFAIHALRARVRRPALLVGVASALLFIEMLPSPRTLHSAAVPDFYRLVAADPRRVAVLNLPFGLKDGMSSYGNGTAAAQFFQTVHGKPIVGGYVSRLPTDNVAEYLNRRVTSALIDLCEGRKLTPERRAAVIRRAHEILPTLNIGYVVINTARASDDLIQFARDAFDLTPVATEGERVLFRTPLAAPIAGSASGPIP